MDSSRANSELKKSFESFEEIISAYLMWMEQGGEECFLFIVDSSDVENDFPQIVNIIEHFLGKGQRFNLIDLNASLGNSSVVDQVPFFTKR